MSRIRPARHVDERGATAILVALLAVALLVLSGFTVDFGQAYISKRNLQKAADAGALAAAQVLTQFPGTCNNVASNSVAVSQAHAAATDYGIRNYEDTSLGQSADYDSRETDFSVTCDPNLKVLLVHYALEGDTPTYFGKLAGAGDSITTDREAEATVDVAPFTQEALRPLALCSAQMPPPALTDTFVRVDYPKNSVNPPPGCPAKTGPGNWWTLDCPEESTGSTKQMEEQILYGCEGGVSLVPGQEDELTPGELTVTLEEACDGGTSESCLGGDPGNIDSGQVVKSWKKLVDDGTEVIFPVFCAPPQCDASTIEGSGTNATYPVYKMVAAVVCGYHFSKNVNDRYHRTDGPCAGNPYLAGNDESDNSVNYLVIKYIRYRASGSNMESECALGAECDGGLRRSRLTR